MRPPIVAAFLTLSALPALAETTSFHCLVNSSYVVGDSDRPVSDTEKWKGTHVDVAISGDKALVTHQLFGFTHAETNEYIVLPMSGGQNSWKPFWMREGPQSNPAVFLHIRQWSKPVRFYLDYQPNVMMGTCT
jgi:hypothetical protein